uniref:Uncharacterized protein n=1 Tax=Oryza meridionalis TaxID=40149 RepID=A0A0E0EXL4_9ORYZ
MLLALGIWTAPATQSPAWAQLQTLEGPSPSDLSLGNPFLSLQIDHCSVSLPDSLSQAGQGGSCFCPLGVVRSKHSAW